MDVIVFKITTSSRKRAINRLKHNLATIYVNIEKARKDHSPEDVMRLSNDYVALHTILYHLENPVMESEKE